MPGKLLCLMRHSEAVANLSETITRDFDKPLTDHGIQQLEHVRAFFKEHHFLPDLIVCSGAVRTRQTLEWIQEALGVDAEIVYNDDLYGIQSEELIQKISAIDDAKTSVLIVGHNPYISDLIRTLLNYTESAEISMKLPAKPSQAAIFHIVDPHWANFPQKKIGLEAFYEPI